jgi:hypothetical protein
VGDGLSVDLPLEGRSWDGRDNGRINCGCCSLNMEFMELMAIRRVIGIGNGMTERNKQMAV